MKQRLALGLWLWTTPEMVFAHDVQNIQSGSLLFGAQLSVWIFLGVFGILLLLSLGGLVYNITAIRAAKKEKTQPIKNKKQWLWVFSTLAMLSLGVIFMAITALAPDETTITTAERAVLYSQGWETQEGAMSNHPLTVPTGELNSFSITSTLPDKYHLHVPELGIDEWLKEGQTINITFVAVRAGIYRSKFQPTFTIQAN